MYTLSSIAWPYLIFVEPDIILYFTESQRLVFFFLIQLSHSAFNY